MTSKDTKRMPSLLLFREKLGGRVFSPLSMDHDFRVSVVLPRIAKLSTSIPNRFSVCREKSNANFHMEMKTSPADLAAALFLKCEAIDWEGGIFSSHLTAWHRNH